MSLEEYLAEHPKKHLIFDLDKTLARLEINWGSIHRLLFEEIKSIDSSLVSRQSTNAREFYTLINQTVKKCGQAAKERTVAFMSSFEKNNYSGCTPNTELLNFIRAQSNEYRFSLWTSNAKSTIQDCIQKENLSPLFQNIITLDDVRFSKPEPDGFYHIFQKGERKEDYLFIGDSENDESAAQASGIDFFRIDYFDRLEAP